MTDTAHRTDHAPEPPAQDDYSEDRHSGVRQLTPRAPVAASSSRLSMAWIASRLKWLLVVGLAWGFAFGFSLGHVLRAPREKIELSERTRIRTPATRPAPVAAAPAPPSPAVTTTVAALAAAPIAPPVLAAPAEAPRAIPEAAAAPRGDDATSRAAWRSAVLDAVERHDARVRDCVRHARSRETVTPGRVRVPSSSRPMAPCATSAGATPRPRRSAPSGASRRRCVAGPCRRSTETPCGRCTSPSTCPEAAGGASRTCSEGLFCSRFQEIVAGAVTRSAPRALGA